jgi:hypothetical protein
MWSSSFLPSKALHVVSWVATTHLIKANMEIILEIERLTKIMYAPLPRVQYDLD